MNRDRTAKALAGVLTGITFGALAALTVTASEEPATYPKPSPSAAHDARVAQLLHDHDCWTGKAPADMTGKMPDHVVITTRAERIVYGGPQLVERALDQVFNGVDHGLAVHGFCRRTS